MKYIVPTRAGDVSILVRKFAACVSVLLLLAASLACGSAAAQALYKYRGPNGEWIYADRPPADGSDAEILSVDKPVSRGGVSVTHVFTGSGFRFTADNRFHAPVEIRLVFDGIAGVEYPHPDDDLRWVIPARSDEVLFELPVLGGLDVPSVQYRYVWLPGDPAAVTDSGFRYRAPFSAGVSFVTYNRPVVTVPVLSNTTAVIFPAISRSATFFISTPSRAEAEIAATIAVGVAKINAQGQEITSIVIALLTSPVKNKTIPAIIKTVGVYHLTYRSIILIIGIFVCSAWIIND